MFERDNKILNIRGMVMVLSTWYRFGPMSLAEPAQKLILETAHFQYL